MPQKAWTDKRERQYEHIKESYEERGVANDEAEERAARTVNKERAEHGETKARKSAAIVTRSATRSRARSTAPLDLVAPRAARPRRRASRSR